MANQDILKSTLAQTSACLAPEQLEALLDGKRSNQHLAECPRCQAELSLLKSFESTEPLRNEGAAVAWISANLERDLENIKRPANRGLHSQGSWLSRIFGVGGMRWVLPAAALAAIVVAGAVMLHTAKEPELRASNTGQPAIYRSQEVQVVSPVGELQQAPTELRWQRFPGAERYRINLMEIDKSSLWNSETKEVNIVIPKTVRDKILPGKPIQWQVTALDANSQVLGTSQIQKFISAGNHSTSSLQ